MVKFFKIVYGYNEGDYLPITADELHKAHVLAIEGGKASFEAGFFQNRGNDVMRIVPDWHRVKGWNQGWKMTPDDYRDVEQLKKSFAKTFEKGKLIAEYAIRENRRDLLVMPASKAFEEIKTLVSPDQELLSESSELIDKFKV